MFKNIILPLLFVLAFFASTALGQTIYTPTKDSAERKAIMDALRIRVEKQLKKKTIFEVSHLKVQNNHAFLMGTPKKADGSKMDYRDTPFQEAIKAGAFDDGIVALLKKNGDKWRVVQYVIGATDVPYVTWAKDYKAPKAIFP
jgi:hypothetical protein